MIFLVVGAYSKLEFKLENQERVHGVVCLSLFELEVRCVTTNTVSMEVCRWYGDVCLCFYLPLITYRDKAADCEFDVSLRDGVYYLLK